MKHTTILLLFSLCFFSSCNFLTKKPESTRTTLSISGEKFLINGQPTYKGRVWQGYPIEGLLMNSRMVQGIFDDLNPKTVEQWQYPDTHVWDANRNTDEFVNNMQSWYEHGLLSFTINLQGGSPQGYSTEQPWDNSAFSEDGSLKQEYMNRLKKILNKADELGMIPILGLFYFGQDERLSDEAAVRNAINNTIDWLFEHNYRNILIEVNNECNIKYDHEILRPERVHELINLVKSKEKNSYRFLVGTSYGGGVIPKKNVVEVSDFLLIHGNGVKEPAKITEMVKLLRETEGYKPKPILFNEDDHFDFEKPSNNFLEAIKAYASWGFFDYRMEGESFNDGYQSVPVNWAISSPRKEAFFSFLEEITGGFKRY